MGFLGGFSTLSTMNCEAVDLILGGERALGVAYVAATYACTLAPQRLDSSRRITFSISFLSIL